MPKRKPAGGGALARAVAAVRPHTLSIATAAVLLVWIVLFVRADPTTHWGAFFGNAIADWSGTLVLILGTKFLIERGSRASRQPTTRPRGVPAFLWEHSLTLFLIVTGAVWAVLFSRADVGGKWGQVSGNITSEWVQMIGVVYLTKSLVERGSPESK